MPEKSRPDRSQCDSGPLGRSRRPIQMLVALGALVLACCSMACIWDRGEDGNSSGPVGVTDGEWVRMAFEVTVEAFSNEPSATVSFSSGTMNVLKWESLVFEVESPEPRPPDYYGAICLDPVGRQAGAMN